MYEYKVKRVVKVVDGDTVDLELDVGFHMSITERFRLADINTPERGKPGFHEATDRLKALLADSDIRVLTGKQGSFRRWIATIMVNGISANDVLLKEGFAVPYVKK